MYAEPADACDPAILNAPNISIPNFTGRWAILISRFNCTFEQKVRNAQSLGYDIVIVHNVNSSELGNAFELSYSYNTGSLIYIQYIYVNGIFKCTFNMLI